jgi:hypothetical protein
MINVLIKPFLLICIHFAQVRSSVYLGTTGKVTKLPFLILIKLYAFRRVVDNSVTCSLGGQCIREIYSIKTLVLIYFFGQYRAKIKLFTLPSFPLHIEKLYAPYFSTNIIGWSNQQERDEWSMWNVWGTGEVHTGFWSGHLREGDHLEDPGIDGRIILRRIFRKWDGEAWTELLWLRTGTGGWHLWMW